LAAVYNLRGAPESVKGFGSELHGQEGVGKTWAEVVDQRYRLKAQDLNVKEYNKLPVCMDGIGVGKTTLLMNGLALLKNHCQHPELRELMQDESHPLVIHLTFNSTTTFDSLKERNPELALSRRVLKVRLGLDWECVPPLGDPLTFKDCLNAIIEYHKSACGMEADQKLFVYLGIDEVNKLVIDDDITFLKGIVRVVKQLFLIRNGFIATLLCGTHIAAMKESLFYSRLHPLQLQMTKLPQSSIETILRNDAKLSQQYLDNPAFQRLLRDLGPVMRAIGIAISELDFEYDPSSIDLAFAAASRYLETSVQALTPEERYVLFAHVLTGQRILGGDLLVPGSSMTWDKLQNSGMVLLVPGEELVLGDLSQVFMPKLLLESSFKTSSKRSENLVASASRLFGFIDSHGPDSFEKFVAHFFGMKKMHCKLRNLFSGALLGDEVEREDLQQTPLAKDARNYDDGVMMLVGNRYPETAEDEAVVNHLRNGGVVLNSKGAAIDALACGKVRSPSSVLQEVVIAFAIKHTIVGGTQLTRDDISADYDKALKVL
jgi:hypothetical protein